MACARGTTINNAPSRMRDPRVGLKAGMNDAGEAISGMARLATAQPTGKFVGSTNSDLAFTGNYAIQGNYNGFQVWDISNPRQPQLVNGYYCPASQSDVSVYKNLLFVSGEGMAGRVDCGGQGIQTAVSKDRLRGIRIFDITDIRNPKYLHNVQTCRGSHTHTVLVDPKDRDNVYVYISGSANIRPDAELPGCSSGLPEQNANTALFRIEVIKVPLADPTKAAIVSSPRIFNDLVAPPEHGTSPEDKAMVEKARAAGQFVVEFGGEAQVLPPQFAAMLLDSVVTQRVVAEVARSTGSAPAPTDSAVRRRVRASPPTAADSAKLRQDLPAIIQRMFGGAPAAGNGPRPGPTQCHDITVYPEIGLAGGACEGYGLLLDISDPVNPKRIAAVADSNFSYWHSATFNNDGTKMLFSDEWGGGGGPKCRAGDPKEWGADAIFTIQNRQLQFKSYYKMLAPQTDKENCVAHNGSLIPIPGRDVMVQSWYQGGVSIFDFTDAAKPMEIGFHDRGPSDTTQVGGAGTWSVYWYNGAIVSSEMERGLDVFELVPTQHISQNEIDAAKTVKLEYLNAQGQPKMSWPPSFAMARAFVDQLERNKCLSAARIASVRTSLQGAESAAGQSRRDMLSTLVTQLGNDRNGSCDAPKVGMLQQAVRDLMGGIA
ncbi:MAG: hypothetical protein IPK85_22770 [Gemmatimonadetes bacterium]|nr:hypothetical protein [Gemmatimonadota bacterium]